MPNQPFVGGIDILPGNQGPPVPANAFRLVTIGGAPYYTTDGVNFNAVASDALATPSTAGLMSAAQFNQLSAGLLLKFSARALNTGTGDLPMGDGGINSTSTTGLTFPGYPVMACTVQNLRVKPQSNSNTGTVNVTVYKNGVATAITAAIGATITTLVVDKTHTVSFADGDSLDMIIQSGAGGGGGSLLVSATVEIVPTAA